MAKKPSPEKPSPSSLLPGFEHLIPSAAAAPLVAHIRPLFLPDLVQQVARNKQIDAHRREQAHPAFRKWAKDLKQGGLQQLYGTDKRRWESSSSQESLYAASLVGGAWFT
jgi:hypothetical protein